MNLLYLNTDNIQPLSVGDNINFFTRSTGNIIAGSLTTNLFNINAKSIQITGQTSLTGNVAINGNTTINGNVVAGNVIGNALIVGASTAGSAYALGTIFPTGGIDFGFQDSTREMAAGKIQYGTYDTTALCIVGKGTTNTTRLVHLWDNLYIQNNLYVAGFVFAQIPVCLFASAEVSIAYYNSSAAIVSPTSGYIYLVLGTVSSNTFNWTPSYTNGSRLTIPYSGIYSISFSYRLNSMTSNYIEMFISKNRGTGFDTYGGQSGNLLAVTGVGEAAITGEGSIAVTTYLSSSDYINYGFLVDAGNGTCQVNCTVFSIVLVQRTG